MVCDILAICTGVEALLAISNILHLHMVDFSKVWVYHDINSSRMSWLSRILLSICCRASCSLFTWICCLYYLVIFNLINKIIAVLSPAEEVTKCSISVSHYSVYTDVRQEPGQAPWWGVHTMTQEMLKSLKQRYSCVKSNEILTISTVLYPRFKDKCFG